MTFKVVAWTLLFCCVLPKGFCGNVKAVWMAPRDTPLGSTLIVNASTSVGALAYAVDNVYRNGILTNGIFK